MIDTSISYIVSPLPRREYTHNGMTLDLDFVLRSSFDEFASLVRREAHKDYDDKLLLNIWLYPIHNQIDKDVTVVFSYT